MTDPTTDKPDMTDTDTSTDAAEDAPRRRSPWPSRDRGARSRIATGSVRRAAVERRPKRPQEPEGESWVETVKTVVYALLIALVIRTFLFQPFNIPSGSMEATLLIGDYLFVEKYAYGYSRYSFPFGLGAVLGPHLRHRRRRAATSSCSSCRAIPSTDYIKRLIGLPGDRIQMINDRLYINDKVVPKRARAATTSRTSTASTHHVPQLSRDAAQRQVAIYVLDRYPDGPADNTDVFIVPRRPLFHDGRQPRQFRRQPRPTWAMFRPRTLSARPNSSSSPPMAARISGNSGNGRGRSATPAVHAHRLTPLQRFEARLGHAFKDQRLLTRALTHASASASVSNERLEFLGDRVLGLVIAEKLHRCIPDDPEGALALKLNALVRSEACARGGRSGRACASI